MSTEPINPIKPPRCSFPHLPLDKSRAAGCLCARCLAKPEQKPAKKQSWHRREIRVEYERCRYPGLSPQRSFEGKSSKSCRCPRCVGWYFENRAAYHQNRKAARQASLEVSSPEPLVTRRRGETDTEWENREYLERKIRDDRRQRREAAEAARPLNRGTGKPLALEEEANAYAWRTRKAARDRCEALGITVMLTLNEAAAELEIYKQCYLQSHATRIPHHVDHRIPLSKGGAHHPDNLQILTATENLKKGSKIL